MSRKAAPKKAAPQKSQPVAAKGYKLADVIPAGEVLTDLMKGQWILGDVLGNGGFGYIYTGSSAKDKKFAYAVKIEPHNNGPLFSELKFYQRCCKPDMIKEWVSHNKLKSLGIPAFIASGLHTRNKVQYRFMVMPKFGPDVQKLFESCGKQLPRKTILMLAVQMLHALEYIHSKSYVHADIKAANMLLDHGTNTYKQAFLVDYGLATIYETDHTHKEYKEDPKRCHDGTIEFTSIDAHKGVAPSRRGDLEILGYCLLQWNCKQLPWEDKLNNANYVMGQKIKFMSDIPSLMGQCFPDSTPPADIQEYLVYVKSLDYKAKPDYNKCRGIFTAAMKREGLKDDGLLLFTQSSNALTTAAQSRKRPNMSPSPSPSPSPARRRARQDSSDDQTASSVDVRSPLVLSASHATSSAHPEQSDTPTVATNGTYSASRPKAVAQGRGKNSLQNSPAAERVVASGTTASPLARQALLTRSDGSERETTAVTCQLL